MKAATESVGCATVRSLPMVLGYFGKVPKHKEGGLIRNPAYDEEDFKALPKGAADSPAGALHEVPARAQRKLPARGTGGCS